jgi:uncharacterized protein involved in exopolysaccharide biosynthesis
VGASVMRRSDRTNHQPDQGGELDLPGLLRAIRRKKWWVILPTLAALGLSLYFVNTVQPRYTAETRVLIESRDGYFTRPAGTNEREALDEQHIQSQVLLVTSRDLARQVVDRLKLRGNPEFDPSARPPSLFRQVTSLVTGAVSDAQEAVVDKFLDRVVVYAAQRSRVITIEFSSSDPQLAALGANALADAYLAEQEAAKQTMAKAAGTWLQGTIEPLQAKLAETEAKVEAYRAKAGLLVASGTATLPQQQLADLNAQLTAAKTTEADAKAKAQLLREALRNGRPFEISEVANNELVRRLLGERATIKAQIALESRTLLPGHPRIKELTAQLADIDQETRSAAEKTVKALENDAVVAAARVSTISAALEAQKRESAQANEDDVQLRALEREAKSQRDQLEAYMARYREATARESREAVPADARIVSRAAVPSTPSFPKKLPIVIISTLATALMSLTLVTTRALLAGRHHDDSEMPTELPQDVALDRVSGGEEQTSSAPDPEPPAVREADTKPLPAAVALAQPRVPVAEPAEETSIDPAPAPHLAARPQAAHPSVSSMTELAERIAGVETSAGQGAAVAIIGPAADQPALGVARLLARGLRVILVDGDEPRIDQAAGLSDLVAGSSTFFETIDRDRLSRLHRIGPGRTGGMLDAARLEEVTSALRQTYDVVIFATRMRADPFAALCDLIVVTRGQSADDVPGAGGKMVLQFAPGGAMTDAA